MKIHRPPFVILSILLGLVAASSRASQNPRSLSTQDYLIMRLQGQPMILLDVRPDTGEFESGHIPGALHLSLNDLDRTTFNLPPNLFIVVTCGGTNPSGCPDPSPAAKNLVKRGFTNVAVLGLNDKASLWTATPLEKGPGFSIPNIVVASSGTAQGLSGATLTVITPPAIPFPDDMASFKRYMTQILPQLEIRTVSSNSSTGKKLIQETNLHTLPAALFDSSFRKTAFYSQWLQSGWINEAPNGLGFLATAAVLAPQIYPDRDKKQNQLDLFIMSQCPFGIQAATGVLQAIQNKKVPANLRFNVHYLVSRTSNPPSDLKGNPSDFFLSLHGISELEEDVRELIILKYFPDKFPAYFLERSKQPGSSLWENAASIAGIDPSFVTAKYKEEGLELIQKEFALSSELGVNSSPTFLWENTIRINSVAHLKAFPPLKKLNIQLSGSCNHPK